MKRSRPIILDEPRPIPTRKPKSDVSTTAEYITSGSFMLDKMLGGGWLAGQVINIIGDKSSGKSLLAVESAINFSRRSGASHVRYRETEHAFDADYYRDEIGLPIDSIHFASDDQVKTVEAMEQDFQWFLDQHSDKLPKLYILDSLDAVSSQAERDRKLGDATYATERAKLMSEWFRKSNTDAETVKCTRLIISQVRDKIGVIFGDKHTRSGGTALDFYAAQIVMLSELSKIYREHKHVKLTQGVRVRARIKKNKFAPPHREGNLHIIFGYGVDDEMSMLAWITEHKAESLLPCSAKEAVADIEAARKQQDRSALQQISQFLRTAVETRWDEAEAALAPKLRKYQD